MHIAHYTVRQRCISAQVQESRKYKGVQMLLATLHVRATTTKSDEPDTNPYAIEVPPILSKDQKGFAEQIQEELESTVLPSRGTFLRNCWCCGLCFERCGL
jgi:hypothetical protein